MSNYECAEQSLHRAQLLATSDDAGLAASGNALVAYWEAVLKQLSRPVTVELIEPGDLMDGPWWDGFTRN
jgi:hypothetical protein